MSTAKAISGNPKKNNGATVLYGGKIAATTDNNVTNSVDFDENSVRSGVSGSKVPGPLSNAQIAGGSVGHTFKPLDSGNFATTVAGEYVIRRVSGKLAGVTKTVLQSGASDFGRRSIHKKENRITLLQVTAGWSYSTGKLLSKDVQTDEFGNDDAARPTRDIPGELVILTYGNKPTQKDYSSKNT